MIASLSWSLVSVGAPKLSHGYLRPTSQHYKRVLRGTVNTTWFLTFFLVSLRVFSFRTMAAVYTPYDGVTRSLSRRPSYHNGPPVGIPYTDPGITYPRTPVMHSEVSYHPSVTDQQILKPVTVCTFGGIFWVHTGRSSPSRSPHGYVRLVRMIVRITVADVRGLCTQAYDDRDYEPYYNDRTITSVAPPMMHPSLSTGVRPRRHSSVSYAVPPPAVAPVEPYFRPNGTHIKFKRKSAFSAGISLVEGQSRGMRLSGNEAYSIYELHPERGSILLKVRVS